MNKEFSDRPNIESAVTIHAFAYGKHRDAKGYNCHGETMLVIYTNADGFFHSAPLYMFRIENEIQN